MNPRLYILPLAPFAFGTSAYVFTGLLEPMASDLDVSIAAAGQLQTAFAVACAIGGPMLARMTGQYDRRLLLVTVMGIVLLTNIASALAPGFSFLVAARIAAGFLGALTVPLASMIAVGLVAPEKRASALAIIFAGNTMAFLLGVPLGSVIGDLFGWRGSFWFAACISAIVLAAIAAFAPRVPLPPPPPAGAFRMALSGANSKLMLLTLLAFIATFTTVAFVGPVVTLSTGLTGGAIAAMQVFVGLGSIAGLALGARLAGMAARKTIAVLAAVIIATQMIYVMGMRADLGVIDIPLFALVTVFSAGALFAMAPITQVRLAAAAGPAATVAFALNGSMIFLGQGLGAALGGSVIAFSSLPAVGYAGALVAFSALCLALTLSNDADRT
ncbi:MFS transporter [Parvularcula sp. IMCC14364]|uniref:MFS transporter n=1 Tax=Parvularcula sp. IMCC14364 TaxID=3067902 RepID=UPI0027421918|nr:MFS transporter [Parvularcula sp. IMCC14364]